VTRLILASTATAVICTSLMLWLINRPINNYKSLQERVVVQCQSYREAIHILGQSEEEVAVKNLINTYSRNLGC
jgi:hypothetical protein